MRKVISFFGFVAVMLAVPSVADAQKSRDVVGYDDRPLMCSAVFGTLMERAHSASDNKAFENYKIWFNSLYEMGVSNIVRAGGTKERAKHELQKYFELTEELAEKQKDKSAELIAYCHRIYNMTLRQ
ncbi:hypothetical protein [Sinorhizobium meliloti]|uniref:hypothetical protein n=1 Tax=Rhizobium meliloti TaxID=382 RepID=UPI003F1830E3